MPVEAIDDGATRMALPTEVAVSLAVEAKLLQDDATIGRAVSAWHGRRLRHYEIRDANQLNIDLHVIAHGARRRTG